MRNGVARQSGALSGDSGLQQGSDGLYTCMHVCVCVSIHIYALRMCFFLYSCLPLTVCFICLSAGLKDVFSMHPGAANINCGHPGALGELSPNRCVGNPGILGWRMGERPVEDGRPSHYCEKPRGSKYTTFKDSGPKYH